MEDLFEYWSTTMTTTVLKHKHKSHSQNQNLEYVWGLIPGDQKQYLQQIQRQNENRESNTK